MPDQRPKLPMGDMDAIARLMRERGLPDWLANAGDGPGQGCSLPNAVGHGVPMLFPPHLIELFLSLDKDEVKTLGNLLKLRPDTIEWLSNKSPKEIKSVDEAISLVNQTKFATRVLLVTLSVSVTIIGTAWGIAQWGWNAFWFIKGTKP
jgi:hypothetical protein